MISAQCFLRRRMLLPRAVSTGCTTRDAGVGCCGSGAHERDRGYVVGNDGELMLEQIHEQHHKNRKCDGGRYGTYASHV